MITLIYCAGGNKRYYEIATAHGFRYGSQLPNTVYGPLWFADQNWKKPDRAAYMAALAQHRPSMASVLDLERKEQLSEVLSWAEEAAQHAERVMIIPKAHGIIRHLPRRIGRADVVLGYSVPTTHGGTSVWLEEFATWPIHLLGGSPQAQMRYYVRLRGIADVISADGNMSNKMSHNCRFWRVEKGPKGHWVQLKEVGEAEWGRDANAEAFRRSCQNIIEAWRNLE